MSKRMVKGPDQRNHVEWQESFLEGANPFTFVPADGQGNRNLIEPYPQYFFRNGDEKIQGENNTLIVLGRDRSPAAADEVFVNNNLKRDDQSGYSNYMGAGAIDIVVGRGAPFPLAETQTDDPFVLGPLFNTVRPDTLQGYPLVDGKEHPGVAMDAARIYISQMTDVDENFKIQKPITIVFKDYEKAVDEILLSSPEDHDRNNLAPSSAIMVKADKIRMHARRNIKIVTRGPEETVDSLGQPIMDQEVGVHLIANNGFHVQSGEPAYQQPMVLGANLVAALDAMVSLVEEAVRITSNFVEIQDRFNMKVANHFHFSPPSICLVDIQSSIQGIITGLENLTKVKIMGTFHDINSVSYKTRFLSDTSEDFICSKYNTTN